MRNKAGRRTGRPDFKSPASIGAQMTIRTVILFVHVVGMLVLFGGLGLEWLTVNTLKRSTSPDQASPWVSVFSALPRMIGIAVGLIVLSGIYLAVRNHAYDAGWVRVSFGAMVLMGILGGPGVRSRISATREAVDRDGAFAALRIHASDGLLRASLFIRVAVGLAVVYLMIGKPSPGESLLLTGVASTVALGVAVATAPRGVQLSAVEVQR